MVDFVETKHKVLEKVVVKNKELEEKQIIIDNMVKLKYSIILSLSTPTGNFKKSLNPTSCGYFSSIITTPLKKYFYPIAV
jgi:hypothetical protein